MSFLKSLNEIDLNNIDLNDIDMERRGSWPIVGQIFTMLLLFSGIVVGAYYLDIESLSQELDDAIAKEEKLKKEFSFKAKQAANLPAYEQQMVEMNETFEGLLRQLPRDTNVPGLIDDITDIAKQSGIVVKETEIKPEIQAEFYVELPFAVVVEGGYHEFGAFVSGIAALPRIVTLHNYEIKPVGNAGDKLIMTIDAKTYKYNDEEGL